MSTPVILPSREDVVSGVVPSDFQALTMDDMMSRSGVDDIANSLATPSTRGTFSSQTPTRLSTTRSIDSPQSSGTRTLSRSPLQSSRSPVSSRTVTPVPSIRSPSPVRSRTASPVSSPRTLTRSPSPVRSRPSSPVVSPRTPTRTPSPVRSRPSSPVRSRPSSPVVSTRTPTRSPVSSPRTLTRSPSPMRSRPSSPVVSPRTPTRTPSPVRSRPSSPVSSPRTLTRSPSPVRSRPSSPVRSRPSSPVRSRTASPVASVRSRPSSPVASPSTMLPIRSGDNDSVFPSSLGMEEEVMPAYTYGSVRLQPSNTDDVDTTLRSLGYHTIKKLSTGDSKPQSYIYAIAPSGDAIFIENDTDKEMEIDDSVTFVTRSNLDEDSPLNEVLLSIDDGDVVLSCVDGICHRSGDDVSYYRSDTVNEDIDVVYPHNVKKLSTILTEVAQSEGQNIQMTSNILDRFTNQLYNNIDPRLPINKLSLITQAFENDARVASNKLKISNQRLKQALVYNKAQYRISNQRQVYENILNARNNLDINVQLEKQLLSYLYDAAYLKNEIADLVDKYADLINDLQTSFSDEVLFNLKLLQ